MSQRKTFAEILRGAGVDIEAEYQQLESVFFDCLVEESFGRRKSLYQRIDEAFLDMDIRGTCISLDGFNNHHGFVYEQDRAGAIVDINELVSFCEYIFNLTSSYIKLWIDEGDPFDDPSLNYGERYDSAARALNQVSRVIEKIGYQPIDDDGFTVFVEASAAANRVAEMLPDPLSYSVVMYPHNTLKGNVEQKRAILRQLANELEPKRDALAQVDGQVGENVFFAFNNFGIRHSNLDPKSKCYRADIAGLPDADLEALYDDLYDLCLLALLRLDTVEGEARIAAFRKAGKSKM